MKKLLIIISLIPFTANSQTWVYDTTFFNNGQYILVKKNPATSIVPTTTRLADTAAAIRARVETKSANNHVHDYSTLTGRPTIPDITGKVDVSSILTGVQALSSGTQTVTINKSLYTLTPSAAMTLNATGGIAGQRFTIIITTSGASSFVVTFGTNFRSVGTLTTGTVTAKKFAVSFINVDGTLNVETGRTIAQ